MIDPMQRIQETARGYEHDYCADSPHLNHQHTWSTHSLVIQKLGLGLGYTKQFAFIATGFTGEPRKSAAGIDAMGHS